MCVLLCLRVDRGRRIGRIGGGGGGGGGEEVVVHPVLPPWEEDEEGKIVESV